MRLTAKLLNSDAVLNSWVEISAIWILPGENRKMVLRLHDLEQDIRYLPPDASAILKVTIPKTDGDLVKTASLNMDDRSLATVDLSQAETEDIIGGALRLELDEKGDGTDIKKGYVANAIGIITGC